MKKMFLMALALVVLSTAAFAQANLLVNGDFETGDISGWSTYVCPWSSGQTIVAQDAVVFDGGYSLNLKSNNSSFAVYQEIATVAGTTYAINGAWKGTGSLDWVEVLFFNKDTVDITWQIDGHEEKDVNGNVTYKYNMDKNIIYKVDGWGLNGPQPFGWEDTATAARWFPNGNHTNLVTATGSTMVVALKAGTVAGAAPGVNAYFDNFSITAVPEPSSLLALVSGIGAMGFGLRRKIR